MGCQASLLAWAGALLTVVIAPATATAQTSMGQSFSQILDLDPANQVGPRLTWTVTTAKLGNRLFGELTSKITLIDAISNPAKAYEFASDRAWNRILFGEKDVYVKEFRNAGTGLTNLRAPSGLDISSQRTLFIADRLNSRVVIARFDPVARTLAQIGIAAFDSISGSLNGVTDVAWDGRTSPLTDEFWYAVDAGGQVSYWQWTGSAAIRQWSYGSEGDGVGQFRNPTGICVGRELGVNGGSLFTSHFYVADAGNRRVVGLYRSPTGATWSEVVALPDSGVPSDCTVDHFGQVTVADSKNHRLLRFNSVLWLVDSYGVYGEGPASQNTFSSPSAVHVPFGKKLNSSGQAVWYGEGRILTAEKWSAQTGALEHYLGVSAAFTAPAETSSVSAWIPLRTTNAAYVTAEVLRQGAGTIRTLYSNQLFSAGNWTLFWDGRLANGTGAPPDNYLFRVTATSAYGCPGGYSYPWCFPLILSNSFFFKYCPPSDPLAMAPRRSKPWRDFPHAVPPPPCGPSVMADGAGSATFTPTVSFLRQRFIEEGHPLARVTSDIANAVLPAEEPLAALVRRYGLRGLRLGVADGGVPSRVRIDVYSASGRKVRTLVNEELTGGIYDASWDGLDDNGRQVLPGVYVARMTVGSFVATQRLLIPRE